MENIVQAVEGAISAVETEAKKVEREVIQVADKIEPACGHIFACVKCHFTKAEILTQAEDEAHALDGAFMRFVRRVWSWV